MRHIAFCSIGTLCVRPIDSSSVSFCAQPRACLRLLQEDLCCAYRSALAVLGVTMDGQRLAGMINNRVFEALACAKSGQARFLSDPFTELEHVFGQHIRYRAIQEGCYGDHESASCPQGQ
jgi:hypothetical protein